MITPLDPAHLPTPGKQRVLVAVLPSPADLVMADQQGWYRVPVAHAPAQLGADYLAFYQTGAFPTGEKWQVSLLTVVRRVRITTRAELLPEEADHPRAQRSPAGACGGLRSSRRRSRACWLRVRSTACGTKASIRTACGMRCWKPGWNPSASCRGVRWSRTSRGSWPMVWHNRRSILASTGRAGGWL